MRLSSRFLAALVIAAAAVAGVQGCGNDRPDTVQEEEMKPRRPISEVLNDNVSRLMKIEGVVGVYEGVLDNGKPCITVMVKSDRPGLKQDIPTALEGYPVKLEIGGEIRPMR